MLGYKKKLQAAVHRHTHAHKKKMLVDCVTSQQMIQTLMPETLNST